MKIQRIGFYGTFIGFLFLICLTFLNMETTGAIAIMFFGLGLQTGALAFNNGGY